MKNREYTFKVEVEKYGDEITYVVKYFNLPVIGGGLTIKEAISEAEDNKNAYLDSLDEINEEYPEITNVQEIDLNKYYVVEINITDYDIESLQHKIKQLKNTFGNANMIFVPMINGTPQVKFDNIQAVEAFNILMKEIERAGNK